jgi:hypothetical protein
MKYLRARVLPQQLEVVFDVNNIERIEPTNHFNYSHVITTTDSLYVEVYIINIYNKSMKPLKDPDSALSRYLDKQSKKPTALLWFDRV